MAAQNDQSVTIPEMTLHVNGLRPLPNFGQPHLGGDFAFFFITSYFLFVFVNN